MKSLVDLWLLWLCETRKQSNPVGHLMAFGFYSPFLVRVSANMLTSIVIMYCQEKLIWAISLCFTLYWLLLGVFWLFVSGFCLAFCFLKVFLLSETESYVRIGSIFYSTANLSLVHQCHSQRLYFKIFSFVWLSTQAVAEGRNLFLFMWELLPSFEGFSDADLINMQIALDVSAQINILITFIAQDNCFSWPNIKSGCQDFPRF